MEGLSRESHEETLGWWKCSIFWSGWQLHKCICLSELIKLLKTRCILLDVNHTFIRLIFNVWSLFYHPIYIQGLHAAEVLQTHPNSFSWDSWFSMVWQIHSPQPLWIHPLLMFSSLLTFSNHGSSVLELSPVFLQERSLSYYLFFFFFFFIGSICGTWKFTG